MIVLEQNMALGNGLVLRAAMLIAAVGFAAAGAGFISNDALFPQDATAGRTLLQAKKDCSVSFEDANFTVITSRCKGPLYQKTLCCPAYMELACPYSDYLNDQTTTCAQQMISLINMYGKYPPGIFSNMCKDSNRGLECPEGVQQIKPGEKAAASAAVAVAAPPLALLALSVSMSLRFCLS